MKIGHHNTDESVFIIAEIGNCHEGDFDVAKEMVVKAADCGVDAVKFQTIRAEHLVSRDQNERYEMLKSFELSWDQFEELKVLADSRGVIFLSTPFDLKSAHFLNDLVPAFKIASGDNTFYPLIELVASFDKPLILSTGLGDLPTLRATKKRISKIWSDNRIDQELALLHCCTSYPVPMDQANLFAIRELATELGCLVGYSDHTLGIEAAILSVATGARVIEKHFTLDHNFSKFRDHQLSADPKEMGILVKRVRAAESYCGVQSKCICECELAAETVVRRSIATTRKILSGQIITMDDITWVRPGTGIAPGNEDQVLGKIASCDIDAFSIITDDMLLG